MICVVGERSEKSLLDLLGLTDEVIDDLKADDLKSICFLLNIEYTTASEVREILKEQGVNCTLINARFVKEFDKEMIRDLSESHKLLVTMEENVTTGGFGERVVDYVTSSQIDLKVEKIALPDMYIEHGNVNILYKEAKIDEESVAERILSVWNDR